MSDSEYRKLSIQRQGLHMYTHVYIQNNRSYIHNKKNYEHKWERWNYGATNIVILSNHNNP